ncbi:hypothetical protein NQ176_g2067 [Zarea fungicola]|uniref:Uncharacterized protein n=1 Tax=Zarea fungicola TaxID=93591 RepID=A0ACC1NS00_9HYPO|nr:hypothetical protein NQ176_g2067 [Lecanicillium fungicola]
MTGTSSTGVRRLRLRIVAATAFLCFVFYYICFAQPLIANLRASRLSPKDVHTFATHAINNTLVVVPVNTGMMYLADNLLCSLSSISFNTSAIVFWALDEGAQEIMKARGYATYRDAGLFSASGNENMHGFTAAYRRMMRQRPLFFRDILASGFDILMLDADIVFWQSPLVIVPQDADRESVDMVYSTDAREFYTEHDAFRDKGRRGSLIPPICNGMFWMKSNKETVSIWSEMLAVFEAPWWKMGFYRYMWFQDDQRGVDVLLNDGRAKLVAPFPRGITQDMVPNRDDHTTRLNVRLLDQTQVANGQLFMNREDSYRENLVRIWSEGEQRIAVHMNWGTHSLSKLDGAKKKHIYYLDDEGSCMLSP